MPTGLGQGINEGLSGLAAGIAQRKKSQAEMEAQQRAADFLRAYMQSGGQIGGGYGLGDFLGLQGAVPFFNERLKPQEPPQLKTTQPDSYYWNGQSWVPVNPGHVKPATEPALTPTSLLWKAAGGDTQAKSALDIANQQKIDLFGQQAGITAQYRPGDKIQYPGPDGKPQLGVVRIGPTGESYVEKLDQPIYEKPTGGGASREERLASLTSLESLFKTYMSELKGTASGRAGGTISGAMGAVGLNPSARMIEKFKYGLTRLVGKKVFGEQRFTDQDVEQIISSLPALTDTEEERGRSALILWNVIQNAKGELQKSPASENPQYKIEKVE